MCNDRCIKSVDDDESASFLSWLCLNSLCVKFQRNIKCSLFIKHLLVVTCFIVVLALMAFFVTFIFECSVCCGDEKAVRMVCVVIIILRYIQFNVKWWVHVIDRESYNGCDTRLVIFFVLMQYFIFASISLSFKWKINCTSKGQFLSFWLFSKLVFQFCF